MSSTIKQLTHSVMITLFRNRIKDFTHDFLENVIIVFEIINYITKYRQY